MVRKTVAGSAFRGSTRFAMVVLILGLGGSCGGKSGGGQGGSGGGGADGEPGVEEIYVSISPVRLLDLVVMVDNSLGMPPKVEKMNAQFPKLVKALENPSDGTLPDLRIAIIDSDLGSSGGDTSNNGCGFRILADGSPSDFGDLGRFQMLKKPRDCTFNDGALFLEYRAGQPVNYTGDINNVLACLTGNLGQYGCGQEHSLQAFEFALAAQGVGNEAQQQAFLRSNAYLGLIFITDEDDCSAAPNGRLFGDIPEARGESASLRCATRAHKCGGKNLSGAGADLPHYPTTSSYTHAFADCEARIGDECGPDVDTSKPTDCNPLRSITSLADGIKSIKSDPDNQILVAGIFGWPLDDPQDPSVFARNMAAAEYKIAPVPNANTADALRPLVYDYWSVCYDPDHLPSDARRDPTTGLDTSAEGWGATGGLRNAAFIDQFGASGLKFSICHRDFSHTMTTIGTALARRLQNMCVDAKLVDIDEAAPGLQADCRVVLRTPMPDPNDPSKVVYQESPSSLPQCPTDATNGSVASECWLLATDTVMCPNRGQIVQVLRTAEEISANPKLPAGTKLAMQCRTCPATGAGAVVADGCDY